MTPADGYAAQSSTNHVFYLSTKAKSELQIRQIRMVFPVVERFQAGTGGRT